MVSKLETAAASKGSPGMNSTYLPPGSLCIAPPRAPNCGVASYACLGIWAQSLLGWQNLKVDGRCNGAGLLKRLCKGSQVEQ